MRRDIGSGAMPDLTVGFVGMTHLAINSLAAMAARGFKVVGFDTDSTRTGPLQRGELPFAEPDLPEYFAANAARITRSEEHTSELQSLMRISYAVFCLKKKKKQKTD